MDLKGVFFMFFKYKNLFFILAVLVFTFFVSTISNAETSYFKFNYGISTHDMDTTTTTGTITHDDEDEGFIFSAGYILGDFWGVDFMYYDLGSTTLGALDVDDVFKIGGINHYVTTAGSIKNNIAGYGIGLIGTSNNDSSELFSWDTYLKAGLHSWDKSGSTTLLQNNTWINGEFFSQGIGAYGGVGAGFYLNEKISIDIAYDIIGLSKDASFDSSSTLISLGLKAKF